MTTSTNDNDNEVPLSDTAPKTNQNSALADGLTLVRICLTPVIMFVIIKAWSAKPSDIDGFVSLDLKLVLLASLLFVIAAITDVLDDVFGGNADAGGRKLGWFDDIADSLLIIGTLLALTWVVGKAGLLHWSFAAPVLILVLRDIVVGLIKSYKFSKSGFQEAWLGDLKNGLAMLATCILVAAPWLSNLVDSFRVGRAEDISLVYNSSITLVWNSGLVILWIAALLSIYTGKKLLITKSASQEET